MSEAGVQACLAQAERQVQVEAQRLPPGLPSQVRQALGSRTVLPFTRSTAQLAVDEAVAAARAVTEAELLVHGARAPLHAQAIAEPRPTFGRHWPVMVAAVAIFIVGVGLWGLKARRESGRERLAQGGAMSAVHTEVRHASRKYAADVRRTRSEDVDLRRPQRQHARDTAVDLAPEPLEPESSVVLEDAVKAPTSVRPSGLRSPSLAELDALAQRQWAAGDLKLAAATFEQIVARGRRSRYVELAYGDLFTLDAQRELSVSPRWQRYLRRFPEGRWAEDARAGLCRTAKVEKRTTCWADFLEHHPAGVHAAAAKRALAR